MPKLVNKVVFVNGRRTSMRMCQREWSAFEEVCGREKISRNELLGLIEECKKDELGLTYSTRLFIISYFWNAATETGHANAGHSCNGQVSDIKKNYRKFPDRLKKHPQLQLRVFFYFNTLHQITELVTRQTFELPYQLA